MTTKTTFEKDPQATLDYKWDWAALTNLSGKSDWLEAGETITTATVTAEAGLTVVSYAITNSGTSVTAWLYGGTAGNNYDVTCHIVTSTTEVFSASASFSASPSPAPNRTDERTITIYVVER